MEQLTFSQHVAANGGSLPWQDAVRLTLLTIQTISAQADPETTGADRTEQRRPGSALLR